MSDLSEYSEDMLRQFSERTIRMGGARDRLARIQWFDFLMQIVASREEVDAYTLSRRLNAMGDWPPGTIEVLLQEYEFGVDLLVWIRDRNHG